MYREKIKIFKNKRREKKVRKKEKLAELKRKEREKELRFLDEEIQEIEMLIKIFRMQIDWENEQEKNALPVQ